MCCSICSQLIFIHSSTAYLVSPKEPNTEITDSQNMHQSLPVCLGAASSWDRVEQLCTNPLQCFLSRSEKQQIKKKKKFIYIHALKWGGEFTWVGMQLVTLLLYEAVWASLSHLARKVVDWGKTTSCPDFSDSSRATATGPWILETIYNASEKGETTCASESVSIRMLLTYLHSPKTRLIKNIQSPKDSQFGPHNSRCKFSKVQMARS